MNCNKAFYIFMVFAVLSLIYGAVDLYLMFFILGVLAAVMDFIEAYRSVFPVDYFPFHLRWDMLAIPIKLRASCVLWDIRGLQTCKKHGFYNQSWITGKCRSCETGSVLYNGNYKE